MTAIKIFAAGSLRGFLKDISQYLNATSEFELICELGPTGTLRERIMSGESTDLFLSASFEHANYLLEQKKAVKVEGFARNRLCLFGRFLKNKTKNSVIDILSNPSVRVGTSTPGDDPGGDYAFEVFKNIDTLQSGMYDFLSSKAHVLVGGKHSDPTPKGKHPVYSLFEEDKIDCFLGYFTSAIAIQKEIPSIQILDLPEAIGIKTEYASAVMVNSNPRAIEIIDLMRSDKGRSILEHNGFSTN